MKIATVLGTRPEIIRLSLIIAKLDSLCEHVLIHTGQNFDRALSDVFFEEMGIRAPDHFLAVRGDTPAAQVGQILQRCERIFLDHQPDRLLILGDTNSALCAIIAKRLGIPVFHMEAGNRCYDDRVPEEVNRRLIDHSSDILMPYTERSRANLLREGFAGQRVHVIGNPIREVIEHHHDSVDKSDVLDRLTLKRNGYFLVTLHRAENVDVATRLNAFMEALARLSQRHEIPVIVSTHPRTADRMRQFGVGGLTGDVRFPSPFGFFDFIRLEKSARCVLSDSGTVQEECAIFGVPNVTLRDVTERPETLERGSNILTGADPDRIGACVNTVLTLPPAWDPPPEYMVCNVSDTVVRLVTGFHMNLGAVQWREGPAMAGEPPITVVTPVFNGANWIRETLESVLAQDYPGKLEYIVLDDGSTDDTADVLAPYAARGVRIVSHANMGEAYTVNRGATLASHDLFAVVNADDPLLPGWACGMAAAFVADPDLSAAYPDWRRIDVRGQVLDEVHTQDFDYAVLLGQHFCLPGPGAVLRLSHLRGEPVRDPARGTSSDYDLWLRLGLHGRMRRVPLTLATWRRHAGGTSSALRGRAMAADKIGTIHALLGRADLPAHVRVLGPMALSAAYLNAALLGLRTSGIPTRRYAALSYWHKPIWPAGILRQQRRSIPHLAYAAAQPVSGWLHAAASPLLPRQFRRSALLGETFRRADA